MAKVTAAPKLERVLALLRYSEETGDLRWTGFGQQGRGTHKRSGRAGHVHAPTKAKNRPYVRVTIDGVRYMAHTLIWYMQTGEWLWCEIDHCDGNGLNNRWNNLRRCTPSLNNGNQHFRSDNTSGAKGVCYKGDAYRSRPWVAVCEGRHIGYLATVEEAGAAYDRAAKEAFGDFALTNS